MYLLFNEAKPSHRFWLAPELHLLYMCSFPLVCLLSLLFLWPCIPKYPPVLPNLRRQQSHVLHWNLLYSLRNFNSPITLNSRSTSFCDAGLKSLGSELAFLSSTGSFHLLPTSKCLSGLLDLCLPLLFLTLHIPFIFGALHCPSEITLVRFSSLDDQGIRKYSSRELVSTGTS